VVCETFSKGKGKKKGERRKKLNFHLDQEAIHRLRNYAPPPTSYGQVPLSRRAAVLILLYVDPNGNLRVVITMRAKTLSSCTYLSFSGLRYAARHADPDFLGQMQEKRHYQEVRP